MVVQELCHGIAGTAAKARTNERLHVCADSLRHVHVRMTKRHAEAARCSVHAWLEVPSVYCAQAKAETRTLPVRPLPTPSSF